MRRTAGPTGSPGGRIARVRPMRPRTGMMPSMSLRRLRRCDRDGGSARRQQPSGPGRPRPWAAHGPGAGQLRRPDRGAVGAGRLLRHRQPDLERAVVSAGDPRAAAGRRAGRGLHRRRSRSEFLLHRPHPSGDRLHRRHPPRQPAAAPAVQGDLCRGADARGVSGAAAGPSGAAGRSMDGARRGSAASWRTSTACRSIASRWMR